MRWRAIGIPALFGLACAVAVACGGGGGHGKTTIITKPSFPQGFLPILLEGPISSDPCQSSVTRTGGDVALGTEGDLFAVAQTSDVYAVSRTNGSCRVFAHASGNPTLLSITLGSGDDTRLFAGDASGQIWVISADGSSATVYIDTGSQPITGLVFAPKGYGDVEGSLLAAAGSAGVLRITIGDLPAVSTFAPSPSGSIVDLAFSAKTLFAIRQVNGTGQIDKIDAAGTTGTASTFQTGFTTPVGIAVDTEASEIYVADAGDDILKTVPVDAAATPTKRARYDFDPAAVDGLAFDGIATLAWITTGPLAIRASSLPRIDPANKNLNRNLLGPTSGYGDLELDRKGAFVLVANDDDDPAVSTDTVNNFLFSVPRDAGEVGTLKSGIGVPPEQLFGVAIDQANQVTYLSSFSLGSAVESGNIYKRDSAGNVSLLVTLTPNVRVLGLELAPPTFGSFGGQLIATTEDGRIFAIDPQSPTTPVTIATVALNPPSVSHLVDLVFAITGELYVVENNETTSHILRVSPTGTVTNLQASTTELGLADGIEIDEGADRLLVTSQTSAGFQLLEVSLGSIPATVKALAGPTSTPPFEIDDGFFPTGVVYDRLGTVVYRKGNLNTQLGAASVAP